MFTVVVIFYVVSGALGVIGLESLANLANLAMLIFLILLTTWLYLRYSGEHRNLTVAIDQLADVIWENVRNCTKFFLY